jgi:hypothetical protein
MGCSSSTISATLVIHRRRYRFVDVDRYPNECNRTFAAGNAARPTGTLEIETVAVGIPGTSRQLETAGSMLSRQEDPWSQRVSISHLANACALA